MFDIDRTYTLGRLSLDLCGGGWSQFTLGVSFHTCMPWEYAFSLHLGILCVSLIWERDWDSGVEAEKARARLNAKGIDVDGEDGK